MQSWAPRNTPTKRLFGTFARVFLHLNRRNISFVLDLNYICTHLSWVQMQHYPICPRDKCHICPSTKHRQIWQMSCFIYIWPTFVFCWSRFFTQCIFHECYHPNSSSILSMDTDEKRDDDDDETEEVEATCTLLPMLYSSSTYCREREKQEFAVHQWTWVQLTHIITRKLHFPAINLISPS